MAVRKMFSKALRTNQKEVAVMNNEKIRVILRGAVLAGLIACCAVPAVNAQTAGSHEAKNNTLNVYLWGASIGGDLSFPQGDQSFDVTLKQILENLKLAGMVGLPTGATSATGRSFWM